MYFDTVTAMADMARAKNAFAKNSPFSYFLSSMMAGAYVGIGIVLIFSIGAPLSVAGSIFLKPVMGLSFGIALLLVVFAGSELFTGNNMVMTIGVYQKQVSILSLLRVWFLCFTGNLTGSILLAGLVVASGAIGHSTPFILETSSLKMTLPAAQLFLRGILCNWLVCLALWTSARAKTDTAKCLLIMWCLFAFIACGYEHSVANMTLLGMALFSVHGELISWSGFIYNLLFVTAGNIIGGSLFVGGAYLFASGRGERESRCTIQGE